MFSKKELVFFSLILAAFFHFLFYLHAYGPSMSILEGPLIYLLAIASASLMIFVYLTTKWRLALSGISVRWFYDMLVIWILICFFRSFIEMRSIDEVIPFIFGNYMGLSMFPVLFFIAGLSVGYFYSLNKILTVYFFIAAFISFFFINYFEFQHFIVLFIFYMILTIPLRKPWSRLAIVLVSISIIITSLTNRAEILRVLISYLIIIASFLLLYKKVHKSLLVFLVFIILMLPIGSLYLGSKGISVFQMFSRDSVEYSQIDPYADTRTFLYYEVFQDLKQNQAFLFGKGLNAGYYSHSFQMDSRAVVEVGFLQILLKTGILGFLLYISVIISSIIKALRRSRSQFVKSLGIYLASYIILLFIEIIVAYNLLNVVTWIVVGMCQSESLMEMNDQQIMQILHNKKPSTSR